MESKDYHFYKFLKENYYNISYEIFSKNINSHPDYPSLLAYSETLSFLGIENLAAQVPKEEFDQVPEKFIALINENNENKFVYVKKISNDHLIISYNKTKQKYKIEQFFNVWDGIILAIDQNEVIINKSNNKNKVNWFFYTLFSVLFLLVISNFIWLSIFSILLSIIGFFFAFSSSREELGLENEKIQKICNYTEKSSCNEVIKSKGGKVFNIYSLSDLALSYFFTCFLLNMFMTDFYHSFSSLLLSIFSIIIIGYSLFYQYFVVKYWCSLCLGIAVVLLLQSLIGLLSYDRDFSYQPFILFSLIYSILLVGWSFLKTFIKKSIKLDKIEVDFLKFKRNRKIFKALLDLNEPLKNDTIVEGIQYLSNEENITGILSPSCGFCKSAFFDYKNLIDQKKYVNIIFNVNPDNLNNKYLEICYFILNEYNIKGYDYAVELLSDWYSSSFDIELWLKKNNYSVDSIEKEKIYEQLKKMFNWCQINKINYTPCTVYKNRIYPTDLEIIDLKFFVE